MTSDDRHDTGSATVSALAVIAVLAVAAGVSTGSGAATLARHRAGAVADLSALAAAARVVDGEAVACAAARAVAEANGARLVSCTAHDGIVAVRLTVAAPAGWRWLGEATGRARAGPTGAYPHQPG